LRSSSGAIGVASAAVAFVGAMVLAIAVAALALLWLVIAGLITGATG
jgi:hypothetical protein